MYKIILMVSLFTTATSFAMSEVNKAEKIITENVLEQYKTLNDNGESESARIKFLDKLDFVDLCILLKAFKLENEFKNFGFKGVAPILDTKICNSFLDARLHPFASND
jgi:hypothetical protein